MHPSLTKVCEFIIKHGIKFHPELPSHPYSWLPSALTLPWILGIFFSALLFPCFSSLPSLPTPPLYAYSVPVQLHYIQLYRLCYPLRRLSGLRHNGEL